MVNPVIAADGHTYERQEITQWLASNNTSPKTNLPLEHKALIPNLSVKQQIEELVASGELADDPLVVAYKESKRRDSYVTHHVVYLSHMSVTPLLPALIQPPPHRPLPKAGPREGAVRLRQGAGGGGAGAAGSAGENGAAVLLGP